MAKFPRPFSLLLNIQKIRKRFTVQTQKIRANLLDRLEAFFDDAIKLARGEVTVSGKELTLKQRQAWGRVAAYTAQIINSVASGYDERQIDEDLKELEKLVDEAKSKAKIGTVEEGTPINGET